MANFIPLANIPQRLGRLIQQHDPDLARELKQDAQLQIRQTRSLRWQDRYLLIVASVFMLLLLLRSGPANADQQASLALAGEHGVRDAIALHSDIRVEVTGMLARVWVKQSFRNDSLDWVEGIYRFPLPDQAAVDRMQITVAGRVLEGEIKEKKDAKRIYQKAKQAGQTTSLVEQHKPNLFETRLANIGPGEDIQVSIGFLQPVGYRDGVFSLRLPLTFTPLANTGVTPVDAALGQTRPEVVFASTSTPAPDSHQMDLEVEINSGLELAFVESRYHDVNVHPNFDGYHVALNEPLTRTDRDFELVWAPQLNEAPNSAVMTWDDDDGTYALLMMVPPLAESIPDQPREVIFVIDTSGSMEGASINQARAALIEGLNKLGPHDLFNVIEFDSSARALFDQTMTVDPGNLAQTRHFIQSLNANGGTNMAPALEIALNEPSQPGFLRQVVFITDGAVGNEAQLFEMIHQWLGNSRLFTVGIGSAPNSYFMRKAAEAGRGTYTHIGKLEEVAMEMTALWDRIERPALSDINIDWGQYAEAYPEVIPDLYAGEPLWMVVRLENAPQAVLISGHFGGREWSQEVPLSSRASSESVATLWARSKIAALEDDLLFGRPPLEIREAIVDLALDYQLLTKYTSMVAVDKTPVRYQNERLLTRPVGNLRPAGGNASVAFANTASGWQWQLLLSLLVLLVAGTLFIVSSNGSIKQTPQTV